MYISQKNISNILSFSILSLALIITWPTQTMFHSNKLSRTIERLYTVASNNKPAIILIAGMSVAAHPYYLYILEEKQRQQRANELNDYIKTMQSNAMREEAKQRQQRARE